MTLDDLTEFIPNNMLFWKSNKGHRFFTDVRTTQELRIIYNILKRQIQELEGKSLVSGESK
jgi:hypothetical protein